MKKVCKKCGSKYLHKHGKKRRKCMSCGATCTVQSGRKRKRFTDAYILDRSTLRRIATKKNISHVGVLHHVTKELSVIPPLLNTTKKFSSFIAYTRR